MQEFEHWKLDLWTETHNSLVGTLFSVSWFCGWLTNIQIKTRALRCNFYSLRKLKQEELSLNPVSMFSVNSQSFKLDSQGDGLYTDASSRLSGKKKKTRNSHNISRILLFHFSSHRHKWIGIGGTRDHSRDRREFHRSLPGHDYSEFHKCHRR